MTEPRSRLALPEVKAPKVTVAVAESVTVKVASPLALVVAFRSPWTLALERSETGTPRTGSPLKFATITVIVAELDPLKLAVIVESLASGADFGR